MCLNSTVRDLGSVVGVQNSGLDQDPYQKKRGFKYNLSSRCSNSARLKGLNVRILLSLVVMVSCTYEVLLNPAKVPNFQYKT